MSLTVFGEIRALITTISTTLGLIKDYFLGTALPIGEQIDLASCLLGSTGAALGTFADGASATPGTQTTDTKALSIRWNNHAAPTPVAFTYKLPPDFKRDGAFSLRALVSKTGATVGDATTLDVEAFVQAAGALHDADTDFGGVTNALEGDATAKTITELYFEFAAGDLPESAEASITFKVGPTDGTLGTDDLVLHSLEIRRLRKAA
jgi:hypothetical protein